MVIIIGQDDLQLPNFLFDFIEYGKLHAKIIAIEEMAYPQSYHITRTIYSLPAQETFNKQELLTLIEKAL